jgi:hypothetical protein
MARPPADGVGTSQLQGVQLLILLLLLQLKLWRPVLLQP